MKSRCYYSFGDVGSKMEDRGLNLCSKASSDYPLIVNCAGKLSGEWKFTTDNAPGREDYYLLYMLNGEMSVRMPTGETCVSSGDVLVFPPRYHYSYSYFADAPMSYLWVHFTGSYAADLLSELKLSPLPFLGKARPENTIALSFYKIFDIYEQRGQFRDRELACALESLLLTVAGAMEYEDTRSLERSLRYIHSSFAEDIKIPELARMENLSNSRYVHLFTESMGISPVEYIISLRLKVACEHLCNTNLSVKCIGGLVGYDDPNFFSRSFKQKLGVSPREYRAQCKK